MSQHGSSDAQLLDAARRNAQRLLKHLAGHSTGASAKAGHPPDPAALARALETLDAMARQLEKESASQ